ncbi:hypothetical protein EGW08_017556 [Elysia chlorotica]|uniref:Fibrinogen C-terminal domain-containing protein n=1 Tax=Elysia chlorotica TaxID=188477 RepID=A0A433SZF2_ELYCH|nr:hypothetical protein EGW08_017556 [Elysia chlorotica]
MLEKRDVDEQLILKQTESALKKFFMSETCQKNETIFRFPMLPHPVFYITFGQSIIPVLCDMVTDGGGWIVIQRRTKGDVDFYRDWASYKTGFGTLDTDFWLGNDNIHYITSTGKYELRVDLKYGSDWLYYELYQNLYIASEKDNYRLHFESYSGNAGDSLSSHNGWPFSTYDVDNDDALMNCAEKHHGAWWYHLCYHSNLNGKWGAGDYKGLVWNTLTRSASATFSEMKIRKSGNLTPMESEERFEN